jgi:hypothetical protein
MQGSPVEGLVDIDPAGDEQVSDEPDVDGLVESHPPSTDSKVTGWPVATIAAPRNASSELTSRRNSIGRGVGKQSTLMAADDITERLHHDQRPDAGIGGRRGRRRAGPDRRGR